ncbi:MAG: retroviral-like aspartic protease family protein [Gammaproteobacteria bacterium]
MKITILKQILTTLLMLLLASNVFAEPTLQYDVELHATSSGTYTLSANITPSLEAEFLFDTGASMVMIGKKLFKQISKFQKPISNGKIMARMASGSMKTIPTYILPSLVLANGCDVGPVEIAVVNGATRNLIGLNALTKLGQITIDIQKVKLVTTKCPHIFLGNPQITAVKN